MKITLNGEQKTFETSSLTVDELLKGQGVTEKQGMAVAVNRDVVPKSEWETHQLADGDEIEIIRAVQGG